MKKIHLICNAHIDPIWQWDWQEGASAVLSTFQSAVNLAEKHDYIFCHNEVTVYKYVEEYAPELFIKIQELVKQGKSALEIKQVLEENALDFAIYISVNEMKYLKKGGRITGAAAMIGTLLGLKPVLKLGGEKIDKFALPKSQRKAKEVIKEAIRKDIDSKFKQYEENGELVISVAYTDNKEIAEELKQDLIATFPKLTFGFCEPLSLSVSCHVGPGTIGVAIVRSLVKKNS